MNISPDILQIIANFGALGLSLIWIWDLRQKIKDKESEIQSLRAEVRDARDAHEADLRDWSGIDPRFKTWSRNTESDTKIRLAMEERENLNERIKNLKPSE